MRGWVPYYYHYTSRQFAQDIGCTGHLNPGRSGFVYLTPWVYATGINAADDLALTGKPIEIGIEIDIPGGGLSLSPVGPLRDPSGALIRRGGGAETTVLGSVAIANPPKWIALIEP
jgi:hypothetical protein